jgi:hypothetical protein
MSFFNILFIFIGIGFSAYKIKIYETPILHFLPGFKLHHVIVIEDEDTGLLEAVDFTPINQRNLKTVGKLFLGINVPAEIRIVSIDRNEMKDPEKLVEKLEKVGTKNSSKNKKITSLIREWKNESMNLYFHNCQHFSYFLKKRVTNR